MATRASLHFILSYGVRACHSSARIPSRASFLSQSKSPSLVVGPRDSLVLLTDLQPTPPLLTPRWPHWPLCCPQSTVSLQLPRASALLLLLSGTFPLPPPPPHPTALDIHIAYFLKVLFPCSLAEGSPLICFTVKLYPFTLLYSSSLAPQPSHRVGFFIVCSLETTKAIPSPSTRM